MSDWDTQIEIIEKLANFPSYHVTLIGRGATISASLESQIDELFGYVFGLSYEEWRPLASSVRSVRRKRELLLDALRINVQGVESGFVDVVATVLRDCGQFFEIRNQLVHGDIHPDFERLNSVLKKGTDPTVSRETILNELDGVLRNHLVLSKYDGRTGKLGGTSFGVSEILLLVEKAEVWFQIIISAKAKLHERMDWIRLKMPKSEIAKLG